MGFCLLNNVAVAAAALAARGERVAIVDWDVHHGNGTQAIFWDEHRVLYVSTHQWPLYPGTGAADEVGGPGAPGLTVNVPLPAGATGDVARAGLADLVAPVGRGLRPRPGCWSRRASTPTGPTRWPTSPGRPGTTPRWPWTRRRSGRAARASPSSSRAATTSTRCAPRRAAALGALLGAGEPTEAPTAGGPGAQAVADAQSDRARALGER